MKYVLPFFPIFVCCAISPPVLAISPRQVEDFEAGLGGWKVGGGGAGISGPTVVEDGPFGPHLHYVTDVNHTGGRFLIMNSTVWSGDYGTAAIRGIEAWAKNEGSVDLHMRLLLEGPGGDFFSKEAVHLPAASGWQPMSLPISSSHLSGGEDLTKTLADVAQIRIFHNPEPRFPGPTVVAAMSIDRLVAVPEPAGLAASFCLLLLFPFLRLTVRSTTTR